MSNTPPTDGASHKDGPEKAMWSEREIKLLVAAMSSLKSGPPEIDFTLFQKNGEFNTLKTAQNTWGKLKTKLASINPPNADGISMPQTPKKTPGKRTKKDADGNDGTDGGDGSPVKKIKTPHKSSFKVAAAPVPETIKKGDHEHGEGGSNMQ